MSSNVGLIPYATNKWLAPAAYLFNFAAQQYGIFSTPSMKDVHEANFSFWSPQAYFIGIFFSGQQIFQLAYLYQLCYKLDARKVTDQAGINTLNHYAPTFILGNLCIGLWMFFWNSEQFKTSNVFVTINSLTHLWYVFTQLGPLDTSSTTSILTHVVAKTFAGIGVMDLLQNFSVAYYLDTPATNTVKVVTAVTFGILSAASDWIFGGCMVFDLAAIACGQSGGWRKLLAMYAVGAAAIVTAKNVARPPYVSGSGYVSADAVQDSV